TAVPGVDYPADVNGTLTFPPGAASRMFAVPLVNDSVFEPNRTVILSLTSPLDFPPPGGAALGPPDTAGPALNGGRVAPRLRFSAAAYAVAESAGSAKVVIRRVLGTGSKVSVRYATSNGTAQAGQNYDTASGTLTFAPGELSKTVPITIHPSAAAVGDLT